MFLYTFSRAILRCAFSLGGGMEVTGGENVPESGPLIVASNHASHLDPMILGAAFRRPLHFMARKSLFDPPVFGWFIRRTNAFPLDREGDSRDALRAFGERLEAGNAVVMFPEGTRSPDGNLQEMKPGIGMLAVRNLAPVVPVYIEGSFAAWPRGAKYPRPHALRVCIGDVIVPNPDPDRAVRKAEQGRVTAAVGEAIAGLRLQLTCPPAEHRMGTFTH